MRGQIDYALLFGKIAKDKLEDAYRNMGLSVDFGDFLRLYDVATKEKFHFLYVDVTENLFRMDFNVRLSIVH